jgi:hypothetical protein
MFSLRRLVVGFLLGTFSHDCSAWDVNSFPDPQKSPSACGRDVTGWVCSPDGNLAPDEMNVIEGQIRAIHAGEKPYSKCVCEETGEEVAVEMLVVVVDKVAGRGDSATRAAAFARGLHDRLGVGTCGSGVVLMVSVQDRQVRGPREFLRPFNLGLG